MKEHILSTDRLQGQLIAMSLLLEALLRTLPASTLRATSEGFQQNAMEVAEQLLNSATKDETLAALQQHTELTTELLRNILQKAILRDSAAGRL